MVSLHFQFLLLFSTLVLCTVSTLSAGDRVHFVIDAGHGGKDPGTQQNGIDEKDLTLDLALRVKKVLEGRKYSITLTRDKDVFLPLVDRAEVANKIPGSVFVSLHFNSHHNRSVQGIETFYWPGSVKSHKLASFIQGELNRRIVTRNRGVKPNGELGVLRATKGTAALVECGFISNRWEAQRCQSAWFKQVLAEEIAQALIRYSEKTVAERIKTSSTSTATTSTKTSSSPTSATKTGASASFKALPVSVSNELGQ